jgi:predicted ATPase/DNA-binding SARP family transcriptional activator/Tfp pilus assembly protein PilF
MTRLEIALLGAFQVSKQGKSVTQFETAAARALLIYLVLHPGMTFDREVLADLLWQDQPRSEALHVLRQTLSRLRRAIEGPKSESPFLHVTRQTIQLNPHSDYWLDTDAFTNLLDAMDQHPHRRLEACGPCVGWLTQAADLYRGDLLSGFYLDSLPFEEWLTLEREHFHRQALEVLYRLADCHNQRGEYRQAQVYARRQLELEPWREEAHRQLMVALSLSGQRSAALVQYEVCRRTLSEELGVEPEGETRTLNEQIRDGDLHPSAVPSHNLPAQRTRFVGREGELAEIAEQLNAPDYRLLTLVGSGGVGKTRLALAAGRQAVPHFADGTWFVPLVDVDEEPVEDLHDRLATAIARAMGIIFSGQDDPKTEMLKYLRTRECLMILDNMEHLTSGVDLVLEILQQCPKVSILVTSRIRLNARAERLVQVSGLNVPSQEDAPDVDRFSSVQLFVDRATSPLTISPDDLAQIVQVCQLVEGVPLAIELASALVEHLPLAEIITNLRRDLGFLSTTLADVPERHRQLRAVFEGSWQLLSEPERRTLAQLAVFRGDFDRTAILTVAETQQAELVGLTHKSLLQHSGPGRYTLHALVRQFAAEKRESFPELEGVRDRHSDYYLSFVDERTAALHGDAPQGAVAEIQAEIANVRQAWQRTMSRVDACPDPVPYIIALGRHSSGIARFLSLTGLFRAGERAFRGAARRVRAFSRGDEALSPDRSAAVSRALARLLGAQGHFLVCLGDHSNALTVFQEANDACERAAAAVLCSDRDLAERAMLLSSLGASCNRVGHYALAMQHLEAGLTLARQVRDTQAEITVLSNLAQVASEQGAYDTAKGHLDEMLSLARACDDRTHIALALSTLGTIAWRWGDIEQADRCSRESLAIYKELGDQHRIPRILNVLGILAILRERYKEAEAFWEEGVVLVQEVGDRQAMADALNNLGYINHHHLGNLEKAKRLYTESLDIDREIGHRHGTTSTSSNLGHLYVLMGEHGPAWDCLRLALSEATAIGVPPLTLDALVGVAQLRAETGQRDSAAELLGVVLGHPSVEVDSLQVAETVLAGLRDVLPAEQLETAIERGKTLDLDAVVAELLAA